VDSTVIIDAGALGDSWRIAEAVRRATDLIVVTRLGADTAEQVLTVRSATTASDAPLAAVMTYRRWRGFSRSEGDAVARDVEVADRSGSGGSTMTTSGSSHQ
jgi:hypothetical protein